MRRLQGLLGVEGIGRGDDDGLRGLDELGRTAHGPGAEFVGHGSSARSVEVVDRDDLRPGHGGRQGTRVRVTDVAHADDAHLESGH